MSFKGAVSTNKTPPARRRPPFTYHMAGTSSTSTHAIALDGTDASPLLGRLLVDLPDVFEEVLKKWLAPTECALLARACWKCGKAVASAGLVSAGVPGLPLKVKDFLGSVALLAWAKANRCPWARGFVRVPPRQGGGGWSVAVGAGARLPVELGDVCTRR